MNRLICAGFWPGLTKSFWAFAALVLGLAMAAAPASAQTLRSGFSYGGGSQNSTTTISPSATVAYVGTNFNFEATLTQASSCPCGALFIYGRPAATGTPVTLITSTAANNFVGTPAAGNWTPAVAGTYEVWAEFHPSGVNRPSESGLVTITVLAAAPGTLAVLPATLPTPVINTAYSTTVSAAGGTGPYTFSVSAGALPSGLTLDGNTGVISGTPTVSGPFSFTVEATDSLSATGSTAYTWTIAAPPVTVVVSPGSLPAGTVTVPYSQTITASGGTGPYSFAVTAGALPGGLLLDSVTGLLSGTPTASGSFNFTVTATDDNGVTGSQAYSVMIDVAPVVVAPSSLPAGTNGTAYSQTVSATGGTGAGFTYVVTAGALPAGLGLDSGTGAIAGTPSAAGSFNFTITATDNGSNAGNRAYALTINPGVVLTVNPASLTAGTNGTAYSQTISAAGGTGTGYTFAVTVGSLPGGLTLASNGTLSGTPNAAGSSTFTVTATDSAGNTGLRVYTLVINPGAVLAITPATLPTGRHHIAYSRTLSATGGTGTGYTYSVTVGALPAGLTLSSTGALSGTPSVYGTFNFTVRVQDSAGNFGTRAYILVIEARPNPALDPEVRQLIGAQFNMSQRFAETQISNIARHLEGLGGGCEREHEDTTACRNRGLDFWMAASSDGSRRFGQDNATRSATLGFDYWLSPRFVVGLAGGVADNDQSIGTLGSRLNGDSQTVSLYASLAPVDGVNFSALYGRGTQSASLERRVTADGSMAAGDRDGDFEFGSLGANMDHAVGGASILPYARFDYVKVNLDAYVEQGPSSPYLLRYEASTREITSFVAGVKIIMPASSIGRPFFRVETRNRDVGSYDQVLSYADYSPDLYRVRDGGNSDQVWSGGLGTEVRLGRGAMRIEAGFSDISSDSFEGLGVRVEYRVGGF